MLRVVNGEVVATSARQHRKSSYRQGNIHQTYQRGAVDPSPVNRAAVKRRVRFTLTIDFHIRLAAVGTLDSPLGNDSAVIRSLSLTLIKINRESVVHQGEVVETIS